MCLSRIQSNTTVAVPIHGRGKRAVIDAKKWQGKLLQSVIFLPKPDSLVIAKEFQTAELTKQCIPRTLLAI